MNIRAIMFDLDDTLLRDDRTLSPLSVAVLRRAAAQGVHILPASGRSRDSMLPYVRQLDCASGCVSSNGGEVWDREGRCLRAFTFPGDTAQKILAFARERGCYIQTYAGPHFYYDPENHFAADYARTTALTGFHTPDLEAFLREHPTGKLLLMDEAERVARMLEEARERFAGEAAITCSKPYFLEFNPPEATKGGAMRFLCAHLGVEPGEVLAFGDSLNDLSMLTAAGMGVAVANARPDVRSRVAYVCGSNEEDGPARRIASLLWGEEESL